MSGYSPILVTPNTLTETSNLCQQIREAEKTRIAAAFRAFLDDADEEYVVSKQAARRSEFSRLWLTDVVILDQMTRSHLLITADLDLFVAAIKRGYTAINFNHVRPVW